MGERVRFPFGAVMIEIIFLVLGPPLPHCAITLR
jgi:hypothetical protein